MKVREVIATCLQSLFTNSLWRWGLHIVTVLILNVLIIYFFHSSNQLLAIILATLLWQITWEDWTTRQIDIRSVLGVFVAGLLIQPPENVKWDIAITLIVFGVSFFIYEISVKKIPPESGGNGDVQYHSADKHINENNAPPFIPALIFGVVTLLMYYLLSCNFLSYATEFMLFERMPFDLPLTPYLALIPLFLIAACVAKASNMNSQKAGYTIAYRLFGEGDIYLLAVLAGLFGFTFTCWAMIIAMPISFIQSKYIKKKGFCHER